MPILSISEAARLADIDRRTLQGQITRHGQRHRCGNATGRCRQSEAAPPAAELRHAQDKIAALEDKIADMRAQLEAAQRRELWLQGQIDQIQQRLLPSPRQGIIERIAEAVAKLRRPRGNT